MINARTLAYLLDQCQRLKVSSLKNMEMDENHCRVLGTYSRPDLKIELYKCKFPSAGIIALAEVLGRNQGPSKLDGCEKNEIKYSVFANNFFYNRTVSNREVVAIAGTLREALSEKTKVSLNWN
jgi:hypothetical protein